MLKSFRGAFVVALLLSTPVGSVIAQPAPDNVALAVKGEVGGKLKPVYAARGFWPLWVKDGAISPAAKRLLEYLETADLDGLNPRDYDLRGVREAVARAADGSPAALARAEVALSQAYSRYVRDVRRAPSAPIRYLDDELVPKKLSEADALRTASLASDFGAYVANMAWMDPAYVSLRQALADRRTRWSALPSVHVSAGSALKPGTSGTRVRLLRQRLGLPEGSRFDKDVATAVREFQAAHGLKADGVAGAGTLAALNRPAGWYDRKLTLNLDRARLLPGPGIRHIVVNTAAQQLVYYDDGMEAGRMKVIVGKPSEQTPMLAGMVRYATLNPYWNVPPDVAVRKVATGALNGGTMRKLGFEALTDWSADARTLEPRQVDWSAVASGTQELRLRQLPGPSNAMGKVKFMFPNDLGIYLHDTPERALFGKSQRYFSSGCVRLEDADRLGAWLFGKPLVPPSDAPEQHVALPEPVPVYLTYLTVQPTAGGVAYLDDTYGRDGADPRAVASR